MTTYEVVAPYVTLKVKDDAGSDVVKGYYEGAVVEVADEDQAKAQADLGLLKKVRASKASKADAKAEPKSENPADEDQPASEVPAGNASREAWADYAKTKGAPDDETKPVEEGGLKQTELRDKYGS